MLLVSGRLAQIYVHFSRIKAQLTDTKKLENLIIDNFSLPLDGNETLHILAFFHRGKGARGAPWGSLPPSETLPLPEIWSENNSITKEICITIDFAPPEKIPERKPAFTELVNI